MILATLHPYQLEIGAVAAESTSNWYWLVDGLRDADYRTLLVNTSAVEHLEGV